MSAREGHNSGPLVCDLPEGSRVKVVGLGGIGGALLTPLALFLRSLGRPLRLALIDGDRFEPGNAARMAFRRPGNKAEVKAREVLELLDGSAVEVAAVPEFITAANAGRLLRSGDYVFLCVDNHGTRRLVSDHCGRLREVILLSGGNEGVEPPRERGTRGTVQVYLRRQGRDRTASLTRFHPEIARPRPRPAPGADCLRLAPSVPQILFTNLAVASAMLNAFFACACGRLAYQEVRLDILDARMLPMLPPRRSG
jgi:hypothetical protein